MAYPDDETTSPPPDTQPWPQYTPPEDAVTAPPRRAQPAAAAAELVPSRGPETGVGIAITAACTTLGRAGGCDIVLDDPTVSRHHAELHRDEDVRYILVDTGSLNGLYLNRQPTQRAELSDGDEIWLGKARFVFHLPPATEPRTGLQ